MSKKLSTVLSIRVPVKYRNKFRRGAKRRGWNFQLYMKYLIDQEEIRQKAAKNG